MLQQEGYIKSSKGATGNKNEVDMQSCSHTHKWNSESFAELYIYTKRLKGRFDLGGWGILNANPTFSPQFCKHFATARRLIRHSSQLVVVIGRCKNQKTIPAGIFTEFIPTRINVLYFRSWQHRKRRFNGLQSTHSVDVSTKCWMLSNTGITWVWTTRQSRQTLFFQTKNVEI